MSETGDRSPVYSLYAVVVHLDVMNTALSGHYVCYVKDSHGEWFKIDDSTVCFLFTLNMFTFIIAKLKPGVVSSP